MLISRALEWMPPAPEVPAELVTDDWAVVRQFLPEGWREQARDGGVGAGEHGHGLADSLRD